MTDVRGATLQKLADALNVNIEWLQRGTGEAPRLTGPYRPLGETEPSSAPISEEDANAARAAAVHFARANGLPEEAITRVRDAPPRAYTAREWFAMIEVETAVLREIASSKNVKKETAPPASPLPRTRREGGG